MRFSVYRLASIAVITLLICSCSGTDMAVGVDRASERIPPVGAMTSTSVTRVDLGTLGGASSYAADVNSGNTVVGWSETSAGATRAFRWNAAQGMLDLGTLPGDAMSRAVAVLDGGQILGVSGNTVQWTPVVWSASGSISALPIPFIPSSTIALPTGFNARGDVVGSDAGGFQHGWVWSETLGKYDLSANVQGGSNEGSASAVTSSGLVVLTTRANTCSRTPQCWRTYLWSQTSGYRAIGTPSGDAEANVTGLALNETGTVAGWLTSDATSGTLPYRWAAGRGFTLLANYSTGSSGYGYATAVSSNGTVVGAAFEPASGSIVASTWLANGSIVKLSPDDPNPSVAVAVNSSGTIAGWAAVSNGINRAVIWTPLSQPSRVILRAPTSVMAVRASTASTPCLADARSISSRQALFACVINAGRQK